MERRTVLRSAVVAAAALTKGGSHLTAQEADHSAFNGGRHTFTVDVALDGMSTQPMAQTRGESFVVDGTIYPEGTLPSGIATNDPNAPGGIGKIRCRASLLVPASDITTPVFTFVTELYSLPDDSQTIVVDGPGPNLYVTVNRAVLGGTRHFAGVSGEIIEQNLGLNASNACNLRVTFKLARPDREHH